MIVFPTIELKNGGCVSLRRGDIDDPLIWHVDPVEKAQEFAVAGAEWMHVTDLDAAGGVGDNRDVVIEIIRRAGIPVQVAGGFRSEDAVRDGVDFGAGRIVIGTAAVTNPDLVKRVAKLYPDQIVLAVDVYKDRVLTDGWRKRSLFSPQAFIQEFDRTPLAGILFTDVGVEVDESDIDVSLVSEIATLTHTPVIASGFVRKLEDLLALKQAGNIHGAIIGRALFNRSLELADALEAVRPEPWQPAASE